MNKDIADPNYTPPAAPVQSPKGFGMTQVEALERAQGVA